VCSSDLGELVDWDGLVAHLKSGHLAGAAMDVFEGEFDPDFMKSFPDHPVLAYARENDNLVLTPHIGGSTVDAWRKTEAHAIDMAIDFLRKQPNVKP
jgi:D-3-phosphoglycerate dehydrogenase